jgi:hypothetical protein
MKRYEPSGGEHIDRACERLVAMAPAFMVFNDIRVEAKRGDAAGDLKARWQRSMEEARVEAEKKRAAFEATPEGQKKLAQAKAAYEAEKARQAEQHALIEATAVRTKFAWLEGMGEISGFGGGYESACRTMIYAGLAFLEQHPEIDRSNSHVLAKKIENVLSDVCPGCSCAMHGAATSAVCFIAKNGWPAYVEAMTKRGP